MDRYAYLATGRLATLMQGLTRLRVRLHNRTFIPGGSVVFVVNRFTRLETLLVPFHLCRLTGSPVWSLADSSFCAPPFENLLLRAGTVCTANPDRERQMVKPLLAGQANWVTYLDENAGPGSSAESRTGNLLLHPAALAVRTEFYRQRLLRLSRSAPDEVARIAELLQMEPVAAEGRKIFLVPVNLSCYPLRARDKVLVFLAELFSEGAAPRTEEILSEGTMLFSSVDIDMRFGAPLEVTDFLAHPLIQRDIRSLLPLDFDRKLSSLPLLRQGVKRLMDLCLARLHAATTINHDHLFASLLSAIPLRSIGEEDFRRRIYLLASSVKERGVPCHRTLEKDQVALLTDDRHHRYRDFLEVAEEKGGVTQIGERLVKGGHDPVGDPLKLLAHQVRPLQVLQREVWKVAWMPEWLVRRRVVERVERQALAEFDEDYSRFSRPKERKGRDIGAPLLLKGRSRDLGVVLVHGFLAAPAEVAELARYLHSQGLWVYLVRLKGHGTAPEDLALRTRKDWMESVDRGYALMKGICRAVVLGGFSFGGGIALDCASRVRGVAGVFAVCPPHRLMDISSRFVPAMAVWNRVMHFLKLRGVKMEYAQIVPERPQINYHRLPIRAVWELELFMRQLERKLAAISVPALVVQADFDPVVDPRGSRRLFEMLGSGEKKYRIFPRRRHGILAGEGAEEVHAAIAEFVRNLAASGREGRVVDPRVALVGKMFTIACKSATRGIWLRSQR
ncbi:alpha/beta fold hydrolase [Geomonas sp. RF6]|uniref:alpha/beta hydrolase n=1 Tax=Geomonas sp. RF6 TaxID=2897342 RepID=UPI001E4DCD68|nr:alpha/beta fold hydrolase [Geomonas sp. RF6]UFS69229.1 alpha/beta fold hydrolase [Geomonas sp. RF6]